MNTVSQVVTTEKNAPSNDAAISFREFAKLQLVLNALL
jgi:hypothetical protein